MYEENCQPLPVGDASVVFATELAEINRNRGGKWITGVSPENVVRWADTRGQAHLTAMCRRLLLPGSGITGLANLREFLDLASGGSSCLLCLNHRSNFDVPTLCALLQEHAESNWFQQIIWIAGRKLEEDIGMTGRLVQCFHHVIVTPASWFAAKHSQDELHQGRLINIAAERAIARLRHQGWAFALFPSGTRIRPDDDSSKHPIAQTDSFLRAFEYLMLCNIDGCTLPVSKNRDMTHEIPTLDRMQYTFGSVHPTKDWRYQAAIRFPDLDQRQASAQAIEQDIEALASATMEESGDRTE